MRKITRQSERTEELRLSPEGYKLGYDRNWDSREPEERTPGGASSAPDAPLPTWGGGPPKTPGSSFVDKSGRIWVCGEDGEWQESPASGYKLAASEIANAMSERDTADPATLVDNVLDQVAKNAY